ncbi:MAG: hypothetical protein JWR69_134 [Pedosphaera sp.]|nr:hypothetical protein [Pedosphaera sp.]
MLGALIGGWEIVLLIMALGLIPLCLAMFAFWIWMLVDCIKNESISGNEKVAWVLVIALTHLLGAIIYFFAGRQPRKLATQR